MPFRAECQTLPTTAIGTTLHRYTVRSSSVLTAGITALDCERKRVQLRHPQTPSLNFQVRTISSVIDHVVPALINIFNSKEKANLNNDGSSVATY